MDVRIDNVRKDFDRDPALQDVSLDIRSGELMALLGPSGSGKTTLLRLIAGLERPTSGRILFGDKDASARRVQERSIGFVFQQYGLFRHLTVLENVAFGLQVRPRTTRPPASAIRLRALELLDLVQLSGLEQRYPDQLSGGQRQRVALARALAIEPAVLLLDERSAPWMRRCGASCADGCGKSMTGPATLPSLSHTTRKKPWTLPTESVCCVGDALSRLACQTPFMTHPPRPSSSALLANRPSCR